MSQRMKQPTRRAAPIIDQEGREIRPEAFGPEIHGFRFDFGTSSAKPFGNLTREQRLARLDALAKLLDVAFVVPGTNVRYGIANERVYAHNWIDYKDARYCEGCDLATLARGAAFSARPAR